MSRPRSLARLIDAAGGSVWLIDDAGRLVFVSPLMGERLPPESADWIGSACPPMLLPPQGLAERGYSTRTLSLLGDSSVSGHFCILSGVSSERRWVLGCVGPFVDDSQLPIDAWFGPGGLRDAAITAALLDQNAQRTERTVARWSMGTSRASEGLRRRIEVACRLRADVGIVAPPGCDATALAWHLHHASVTESGESALVLDGSLMDDDLLRVYAQPATLVTDEGGSATLIIERIAEMPVDGQARLASWLDQTEGRLRLIGVIDPHWLSADPSPAAELARVTGVPLPPRGLSDSLALRLESLPVVIPSLADRIEDVPMLAAAVLLAIGSEAPRLSRDAADAMLMYPWPGNTDELSSAMRFAASATAGPRIGREHLPLAVRSFGVGRSTATVAADKSVDFRIDSLDAEVGRFTRTLIDRAMNAAGGNKAEAARRLGISRTRLLRKLDELNDAEGSDTDLMNADLDDAELDDADSASGNPSGSDSEARS